MFACERMCIRGWGGPGSSQNSLLNPELTNTECSWLATLLPSELWDHGQATTST